MSYNKLLPFTFVLKPTLLNKFVTSLNIKLPDESYGMTGKELKYTSQIDLENISLSPKNNLIKNYFNNYKNSILLKKNLIKLKYENKNLNIKGESDYSFDESFDKIEYEINKKKIAMIF